MSKKKKKSKTFKKLQSQLDNTKGNLFLIGVTEGEEREADRQEFLNLLATLDCKPEIKIRTKCPNEDGGNRE